MKIARVEALHCDGGWRPWTFVRVETDDGLVGWGECSDNRSPWGLAGCVRDVDHVEEFLRRRLGLSDDNLIKLTSTDTGGQAPKEPPERRPTYENMVGAFHRLAETAHEGDLRSQTRCHHGLIGALAAVADVQRGGVQCLAGLRQARGTKGEIGI